MANLNPVKKAKYIEDNFRKYISSTYEIENEKYREQFCEQLNEMELLKGPYISKALEFKNTKSINELIEEGIVHENFKKLGDMKLDRKLRAHQEKAIILISEGHNLIVTTGTGSGKTESFLYPILNEILKEKDITKPGVRALFLFPMNALVNDQFDRVRKILNNYPDIKYAFFTGDTKTKGNDSIKEYIEESTGNKVGDNELIDREQIRKNPPHILFTNYSMLEYILLRPNDNALLTKENTENWKFIVLDEAHIYKGALGIEVGMLLRRLQGRIGKKIQFILTSATLGVNDEQGIKQIQNFGYKLTSGSFQEKDILFSERILLDKSNAKYKVEPKDYLNLYKNYNDDYLNILLEKYDVKTEAIELNSKLYDLIIRDENLYLIDSLLYKSREYEELYNICKNYGFSTSEELSSFLDLICRCIKKGQKIMDIKYHSFVRSLSGAYISIGEKRGLSLTSREYIDGEKAFEMGVCKKCKSLYIIGVISKDYLYQNYSVDIYENYNDDEIINLDYFILEEDLKGLDVDYTKLEKYILCPKCGKIVSDKQTNKELKYCEHKDVKKVIIYKVLKDDSTIKNNITTCPICNGKSKTGLISTVSMGKEASTALLTQIFFEAIDNDSNLEKKSVNEETKGFKLFGKQVKKDNSEISNVKQILAFSDSRQQASFSVKFAENNHHRLLRNRLLVEILNNNDNGALKFEAAEAKLDHIIDSKDLFDSNDTISSSKQAKICLLRELLNVDGVNGGEGLGLYYFTYDPIEQLKKNTQKDDIEGFLENLNLDGLISFDQFFDIVSHVVSSFRIVPAIYYDGLSRDDREEFFAYRMFDNHVMLNKKNIIYDSSGKDISNSVHSIISKDKSINKLEKYIVNVFKISKEKADELLCAIWEVLVSSECFKEYDKINKLYSLYANKFSLHSYKDTKWYYCSKCRRITRFNVKGICPHCFNENSLSECNPNDVFKNNYYRYQYLNKKIEKLVYKEHTAQFSTEKGKDVQNNFKKKIINFLSCSTTFEMGIDIGSLENVLLRNVPPSPSNYVQRAGRAGRGQESSAFVLTYCSPTSHDYTFFLDPLKMVEGVCNTPVFLMENKKIIYRHLLAIALAKFFKNNIMFFENVRKFYLEGGYDNFVSYLKSCPDDLIEETNRILDTTNAKYLMNGKWIEEILECTDLDISLSKEKIDSMLKEFKCKKQEAIDKNDDELISYFSRQIKRIEEDPNLIGVLADSNLIPKYGFPTDLVEMKIRDIDINSTEYDLTRDMQIALSEYAPDSEIMVDKKIITSRYVNKMSDLTKIYYCECENCHKTTLKYSICDEFVCPHCLHTTNMDKSSFYVTPKYGFTGEIKVKTSTILKPKRSYSSPIKYIGRGDLDGEELDINGVLKFYTVKNDELLIVNENPFFACPKCGYCIIDKEHEHLPKIQQKKSHKPIYGKEDCQNKILEKIELGYSYKTDVLKLVIGESIESENQAISALYALLEGISFAFDIDRNDIDGIFISEDNKNIFVLYDTVPGGAGHVKRLLNVEEMKKAFSYAYEKVNQNCCELACYNCLKNYKNQRYHNLLRREDAKGLLKRIVDKII